MKLYLTLSVTFLVMINVALGAVGDVGVSDTAADSSAGAKLFGRRMDTNSYMPYESGHQVGIVKPAIIIVSGQLSLQGQDHSLGQGSAYPAPQISGPMQEQLTAEELGLSLPQMESFAPDESLGFVSASLPGNTAQVVSTPVQSSVQPSRSLQFRLPCPAPASGIIPVPWFPPTDFLSRPPPALERWEDAASKAICPSGRTSNQAATSLSMNGIPDGPLPLCDGGAGLGQAGKRAGFAEMSRDGISSATTAAYGPTTSTFMYIPEELPYLRHQATQMLRQA